MYNCKKCPGYCCSYPLIALNKRDVERLAKHFRLSFRTAKAKLCCAKRCLSPTTTRTTCDNWFWYAVCSEPGGMRADRASATNGEPVA